MSDTTPATPATAATPGSDEQRSKQPSADSQAPQSEGKGEQSEGTVTISTKEFAQLQRDKARARSFEKRAQIQRKNRDAKFSEAHGDEDDPLARELEAERQARSEMELELHRERVKNSVRDILSKDEYKSLPESTRKLILKNPSALSDADNVDEALLDIEDFVREEVAALDIPASQTTPSATAKADPPGHETPPAPSAGSPAPVPSQEEEDISKLHGVNRSRAVLRNALKRARSGGGNA